MRHHWILLFATMACSPYRVAHTGSDIYTPDGCETPLACCGSFSTVWLDTPEALYSNSLGDFPRWELEPVADAFDFENRALLLARSGTCDSLHDAWIEVDGMTFVDGVVGVELRMVQLLDGLIISRDPYVLLDVPSNWGGSPVDVQVTFDY